jgi:hypothetical protein
MMPAISHGLCRPAAERGRLALCAIQRTVTTGWTDMPGASR